MMKRIVAGLDIGTHEVKVVVGAQGADGSLEVLGVGKAQSNGVTAGKIANVPKTVAAINKALEQAEQESNVNIAEVIVGVSGKDVRVSIERGSYTKKGRKYDDEFQFEDVISIKDEMHRSVVDHGMEVINVIPQKYIIDGNPDHETTDPVGEIGTRLESDFHVIMNTTQDINVIRKSLQRAGVSTKGLEYSKLVLNGLASSLAVLSEEDKEAGVVLIDFGAETTDIALFYDGVLRYTTVIPYGSNIISSDIREGCAVSMEQAIRLKEQYGKALAEKAETNEVIQVSGHRSNISKEVLSENLSLIIEARLQELANLINKKLHECEYSKTQLPAGVVITGGGANMKHIEEAFELFLGQDIHIASPNMHVSSEKKVSYEYTTAVGLALSGIRSLDKVSTDYLLSDQSHISSREDIEHEEYSESTTQTEKQGRTHKRGVLSGFLKATKNMLMDDFNDSEFKD
ncbi:MAG: cell division protein FtsA [Cytophagales bacterium]|nr:cell division protein FtsA [Cytophagales bacterium]